MSDPIDVLEFWLGEVGPSGWYAGGEDLDSLCRDRFLDLWLAAKDGGLGHWVEGTVGSLAFLVLTDQLPRNMHRGSPEAFATDQLAIAAAKEAVARGWDLGAPEPDRQFFYLPFEHSETLADQNRAVELIEERLPLSPDSALHAKAHRSVIETFGRFPFRNEVLGRISTPQEQQFLAEGGYGAHVAVLRSDMQPVHKG